MRFGLYSTVSFSFRRPGPKRSVSIGPGRHRVDVDAVLGQLESHVADEAVDAGLGRGVRGAALVVRRPRRALARPGRHADDAAVALLHHVGHGGAGAEEGRAQVEAQDEVPVVRLHLPDLRVPAPADVVDQDVDAAEPRDRGVDQPLGRPLVGEVAGHGQRLASACRDGGGGLLEPGPVDVGDGDARALAGQELRDLSAEAVGCSGHDRHAVFHTGHRASPRVGGGLDGPLRGPPKNESEGASTAPSEASPKHRLRRQSRGSKWNCSRAQSRRSQVEFFTRGKARTRI